MRRCLRLVTLLALANASFALASPRFPAEAVAHKSPLAGEHRIRYLLRQIELTEDQARHAEGIIESLASDERFNVDIAQIRQLWIELEESKQARDSSRTGKIAQQLKRLSKDESIEQEFFGNIESELTDRQKQLLTDARERLNRHRSGGMRPGDLMREARKLDLTEHQQQQMFEAFKASRDRLGPLLRPDKNKKTSLLNAYAKDVWAILNQEQQPAFEYRIYVMRPDLIGEGLYVPRSSIKWKTEEPDAEPVEE